MIMGRVKNGIVLNIEKLFENKDQSVNRAQFETA